MKVLITGGAGFLGIRLARRLLSKGTPRGPCTATSFEDIVRAHVADTTAAAA